MTLPNQDLLFQNNFSLSSKGDAADKVTEGFSHWLNAKSYSSSTIRNYLSDVNRYFQFIVNCKLKIENSNLFSPSTVASYLKSIDKDHNSNRYLSSLSKFFQYAIDQNLIKINPLKQAQKVKKPSIDDIIANYQSFLTKKHFSASTIRNYLNDLRQYIDFCNSQQSQNSNLQNPSTSNPLSFDFTQDISLKKGNLPKNKGLLNKFNFKQLPFFKGRSSEFIEEQRGLIEN